MHTLTEVLSLNPGAGYNIALHTLTEVLSLSPGAGHSIALHTLTSPTVRASFFKPWSRSQYSFAYLDFAYCQRVPAGSPSRGGNVTVYVKDINQLCLPTPFYSVLVSISVFMALSIAFHSINSPDNSPFSHSVLPVFGRFNYISLFESLFQP